MNNNKLIYIVVAIAVVIAIGLYWYFGTGGDKIETTEEALNVLSGSPQVQVETNPVKKVPDLNPVEKVNPFKTTNPFQ